MQDREHRSEAGAESVYAAWLAGLAPGETGDIEALCRSHPELAQDLRRLAAEWERWRTVFKCLEQPRTPAAGMHGSVKRDSSPAAEAGAQPGQERAESGPFSDLVQRLGARMPSASRYRLLGEVGRGGMGAVLRVWDEDLRRTLAMKVVLGREDAATGGATPPADMRTLGRFLEEAQITGQLDHPGIVPVHELGLGADGQVYFTMRLVKGEDLRRVYERVAAGEDGWTTTRAVGVLLKVCEAMSYAHDKGVIHRDLKPANIMVGRYGEVYVMDWGLARVTGRADLHDVRLRDPEAESVSVRTERRLEREAGPDSPLVTMDGQIVGTPAYMAPEQARGDIAAMGPHSDVYALGAMLYHLLSGQMPYVRKDARVTMRTVLLALLDGPPRPLSEVAPGAPQELAAICVKAMEREPSRRYADMSALAADLRAWLEGRVVGAYEQGGWAEARKWVRRNRALAASLASGVLVLVAGVFAVSIYASRAAREAAEAEIANAALAERNGELEAARRVAEERAAENARLAEEKGVLAAAESQARLHAESARDFVAAALRSSDPESGGDAKLTILEAMGGAVADLDKGRFDSQPEVEAELRQVVGTVLGNSGRSDQALAQIERALDLRRRLQPGDQQATASLLQARTMLLWNMARYRDADEASAELLAMERRLHADDRDCLFAALDARAGILLDLNRFDEADEVRKEAFAMARRLHTTDDETLVHAFMSMGDHDDSFGRAEQAERWYGEALAMARRLYPGDHPRVVVCLNSLGGPVAELGRFDEAERLHSEALAMARRIYPKGHYTIANSLFDLAGLKVQTGDNEGAAPIYEEALAMARASSARPGTDIVDAMTHLAIVRAQTGRPREAVELARGALDMARGLYPGDNIELVRCLTVCSGALVASKMADEALAPADEAVAMSRRLTEEPHEMLGHSLKARTDALAALGRLEDALVPAAETVAVFRVVAGDDGMLVASNLCTQANILMALERPGEALPLYEEAYSAAVRMHGKDDPDVQRLAERMETCRAKAAEGGR